MSREDKTSKHISWPAFINVFYERVYTHDRPIFLSTVINFATTRYKGFLKDCPSGCLTEQVRTTSYVLLFCIFVNVRVRGGRNKMNPHIQNNEH
jgi:hypothetical protein